MRETIERLERRDREIDTAIATGESEVERAELIGTSTAEWYPL